MVVVDSHNSSNNRDCYLPKSSKLTARRQKSAGGIRRSEKTHTHTKGKGTVVKTRHASLRLHIGQALTYKTRSPLSPTGAAKQQSTAARSYPVVVILRTRVLHGVLRPVEV